LGLTNEQIEKMKINMPSYEKKPYPAWALSNNNAEIRRVKERIKQLEKLDTVEEDAITFKGGRLVINTEINRVQFVFDKKPQNVTMIILKNHGFHWSPSEGAWQRQRTINSIYVSKQLLSRMEELEGGEVIK
jgi:hypothetical protein